MKKVLVPLIAVAVAAFAVGNGLATGTTTKRIAIVHVNKGCHVWSMGAKRTPALGLMISRGSTITVVNQDVDMHQLVQVAGPRIKTGQFMMMNGKIVLRFTKAGHYRFRTRVADMRGMPEAETIGPDNKLELTVHTT